MIRPLISTGSAPPTVPARYRNRGLDAVGARSSRASARTLSFASCRYRRAAQPKPVTTTRRKALARSRDCLSGDMAYDGDRLNYDDPGNADFMSVIDRRRGLPVALGILYLHRAARAAGFQAMGLNTPGHFLLRNLIRDPAKR